MDTALFCARIVAANLAFWAMFFGAGLYAPARQAPTYWWRDSAPARPTRTAWRIPRFVGAITG